MMLDEIETLLGLYKKLSLGLRKGRLTKFTLNERQALAVRELINRAIRNFP